jgi:hypothetical protein
MDPSDRPAFDQDIVNRALQHDCVLRGRVVDDKSVVAWRTVGAQVGPEFAGRQAAIDWMAARLAAPEGADLES